MIEIVTTKGVRNMGTEEDKQVYELLREIESIGKQDGKILFVVCYRESTKLTLFDMMLNTLKVALLLVTPKVGVMYPANALNRRASALCANA